MLSLLYALLGVIITLPITIGIFYRIKNTKKSIITGKSYDLLENHGMIGKYVR